MQWPTLVVNFCCGRIKTRDQHEKGSQGRKRLTTPMNIAEFFIIFPFSRSEVLMKFMSRRQQYQRMLHHPCADVSFYPARGKTSERTSLYHTLISCRSGTGMSSNPNTDIHALTFSCIAAEKRKSNQNDSVRKGGRKLTTNRKHVN